MQDEPLWDVTDRIIAACMEVHRHLGPGLLESAYEQCVCHELGIIGLECARQVPMPIAYKGTQLDCGYKLDLLVNRSVVVELKAVERLLPVHSAQVITYLELAKLDIGLLINFHGASLRTGIKRLRRPKR